MTGAHVPSRQNYRRGCVCNGCREDANAYGRERYQIRKQTRLEGARVNANLSARHPGTRHIAQFFAYGHLPLHLRPISAECAELAEYMIKALPDGRELTEGLRWLLIAKDAFVRAAVAELDAQISATQAAIVRGEKP